MRKISLLISLLLTLVLLTGCMQTPVKKDSYTLDEIYSEKAFGFFVKDGKNFYPIKPVDTKAEKNFLWYTGDVKVPKVTSKTPLVAVFKKAEEMPQEYVLNKFNDLGYTFGAMVRVGDDNNSMWLQTQEPCPNSNMSTILSSSDIDNEIEVISINDSFPLNNVDTDINIFTGLEKNKYYTLQVLTGTKNQEISVCADTRVLKFVEETELANPFQKTQEDYFIVNLPENIHKGYYSINDEGIFQL